MSSLWRRRLKRDRRARGRRHPEKSVLQELKRQDAILDGEKGSHLWVVRAEDGHVLEKHELPALPVWDGMAAAQGRVYLAMQGGVVCLGGEKIAETAAK